MNPGVSIATAQRELQAIQDRLAQSYEGDRGVVNSVSSAREQLVGNSRTALIVLAGAVGLLLLIACANLANLLVARASVRRGEIAVRTSLGASRARILQQLLTESALLAISGGALGIVAAIAGKRLIIMLFAQQLPRLQEVRLSGEVLGFAMALTAFTAFAFGLLPALQCSRMEPQSALRASSRTSSATEHGRHTREMLIVSEFALTLVLLAGAGLLVNTLYHLSHTDPGFRTNNLLTLRVNLPSAVYATDLQRSSFYRDLLDHLAQMPGVVSAGLTMTMPLQPTGNHSWTMFVRGDRPIPPTPEGLPTVAFAYVTPGYFQALGIPLIRGRAMTEEDNLRAMLDQLTAADVADAARAAVVLSEYWVSRSAWSEARQRDAIAVQLPNRPRDVGPVPVRVRGGALVRERVVAAGAVELFHGFDVARDLDGIGRLAGLEVNKAAELLHREDLVT